MSPSFRNIRPTKTQTQIRMERRKESDEDDDESSFEEDEEEKRSKPLKLIYLGEDKKQDTLPNLTQGSKRSILGKISDAKKTVVRPSYLTHERLRESV